jgi:hypothetical protein
MLIVTGNILAIFATNSINIASISGGFIGAGLLLIFNYNIK